MSDKGPLYIGFDLSTQQLKALVVDHDLNLRYEAKVHFDDDLSKYGITKGVLTNPSEGEIYAPVAMWLDAIELVLSRLRDQGCQFQRIKGLSGAGMQHGTVFWSLAADKLLASLDPDKTLQAQLEPSTKVSEREGAFSHPDSPNWQDASTQKQCDAFDRELGSPEELANETGSKAHHRFSGPQIMRWSQKYPAEWKNTSRISLVSSFIASVFLGKVAPIDIGDVCGMNLWHIAKGQWHEKLLKLVGGKEHVDDLKAKLGQVPEDGGGSFGRISNYFVKRFGFPDDCSIIPCTGDNPATILALPLRPADAMVSLGTSTTFLMSTKEYKPDPAYHFMNHPTTAGLYMFMLCYKNGGLAREQIRDQLGSSASWDEFNSAALNTAPLAQSQPNDPMRLGLFFPRHEIVPNVRAGQWRYNYDSVTQKLEQEANDVVESDARVIVESQMLSLRLRSQKLVHPVKDSSGKTLPAQPRRVYLVGGASSNPAIARIAGDVLGGVEGVYKLDIGGNACGLGAAYKATWGCERQNGQSFEDFIGQRWNEDQFVKRITDGYREGVFEKYGEAIKGFELMESTVIEQASRE
ncbi:putative D-Xylulose kinase [Myriangium duriaei CBS 260.36]|uniref:Xylulose kinase n=1 Tax=Myriangium duriaei CBS 260.36 TaxID=1168546 RepID=A0A9P4MID5_9PEZI|nr:putative D-Xylulose kinase [Myriangium duriaei CBS 260.36]